MNSGNQSGERERVNKAVEGKGGYAFAQNGLFPAKLLTILAIYTILVLVCFAVLPENATCFSSALCAGVTVLFTLGFCAAGFMFFRDSTDPEHLATLEKEANDKTSSQDGNPAPPPSTIPLPASVRSMRLEAGESCGLTAREQEVFEALLDGKNARAIERELGISHYTAKAHIGSVYRKANTHSQQELIDWFEQGGHRA